MNDASLDAPKSEVEKVEINESTAEKAEVVDEEDVDKSVIGDESLIEKSDTCNDTNNLDTSEVISKIVCLFVQTLSTCSSHLGQSQFPSPP